MSINTVKSYLVKLDKLLSDKGARKHTLDDLLRLDDPELYHLFHSSNPELLSILQDYKIPHLRKIWGSSNRYLNKGLYPRCLLLKIINVHQSFKLLDWSDLT
ncbi:hypothetical protein A3SI_05202 [Nitritalea halalkaliphila LW7]|uniref:Uncharacterized protein n=1 Tax=Nitritalea halalkaliphila LW7 TaxID=1189621 RepID=I5C871_9BACT|nr:hypothetical protein A3SI_05202 [Nitritalea halalkaliphila LW7]